MAPDLTPLFILGSFKITARFETKLVANLDDQKKL